jgi:hypothetical protein
MLRLENVATPLTAEDDVEPNRRPPAGFVPIATVILPLKAVIVFPDASSAVTLTPGKMGALPVVLLGSTVKASRVAAPTAMFGPSMSFSDDPSQLRMTAVASNRGARQAPAKLSCGPNFLRMNRGMYMVTPNGLPVR